MTTTGWLDETGLIPLPSGARVRGTYHRRAVETRGGGDGSAASADRGGSLGREVPLEPGAVGLRPPRRWDDRRPAAHEVDGVVMPVAGGGR
jgi:hypothetical protein